MGLTGLTNDSKRRSHFFRCRTYRDTLALPGDFVIAAEDTLGNADFLRTLRADVAALRPIPTSRHGNQVVHVPTSLETAEYIFVRRDSHRGPLQRPYDGPFRVIERGNKTLRLDLGASGEDIVSTDRLRRCDYDDIITSPPLLETRGRGRPPKVPAPFPPPEKRKRGRPANIPQPMLPDCLQPPP